MTKPKTEAEKRAARAAYMREYSRRTTRICSVAGCEKGMYGRSGLCAMHYQRKRTTGEVGEAAPRLLLGLTLDERFWPKVARVDSDKCWEWLAAKFPDGYGNFKLDGRAQMAHRIAYALLVGEIPDGMELDHLCRNRSCVNPRHLEPVSPRENKMRGDGVAARYARATHCPNGHEYTEENTRIDHRGNRQCRTCKRELRRRRYLKHGK